MSTSQSSLSSIAARSSTATATNAANGTTNPATRGIADNFDTFLSLLTTQLRNQSPLDPLDANQFTQQLVQFAGVEQQLKSNDLLAQITKNLGGSGDSAGKLNAASAAALIGVEVSADASTAKLSDNGSNGKIAQFPVTIQSNYSNYEVSITNSRGEEVYAGKWTPPGTGEQSFPWDGKRTNGTSVDPTDTYAITVTGTTSTGLKSQMSTARTGTVTSVDLSGSEPTVQFGAFSIPLSKIKKVAKPTA